MAILALVTMPGIQPWVASIRLVHATRSLWFHLRATRRKARFLHQGVVFTWQDTPYVHISFRASFGRNTQLAFTPAGFTQGQQGSFTLCLIRDPGNCSRIVVLNSGASYLVA